MRSPSSQISAIFWPVLNELNATVGWRTTFLIGAGLQFFVCLPLHHFALPRPIAFAVDGKAAQETPVPLSPAGQRKAFVLIAAATTISTFVTFGVSPSLLEILRQSGASPDLALPLGSARRDRHLGAVPGHAPRPTRQSDPQRRDGREPLDAAIGHVHPGCFMASAPVSRPSPAHCCRSRCSRRANLDCNRPASRCRRTSPTPSHRSSLQRSSIAPGRNRDCDLRRACRPVARLRAYVGYAGQDGGQDVRTNLNKMKAAVLAAVGQTLEVLAPTSL